MLCSLVSAPGTKQVALFADVISKKQASTSTSHKTSISNRFKWQVLKSEHITHEREREIERERERERVSESACCTEVCLER